MGVGNGDYEKGVRKVGRIFASTDALGKINAGKEHTWKLQC